MKITKTLLFIITALMACICIVACTPTYYEEGEDEKIEEQGRELIEKYAKSLGEDSEVTYVSMMTGAEEGNGIYAGYYLSHVVQGRVKLGDSMAAVNAELVGKEVTVYVNTEDSSIWTGYDSDRGEMVNSDKVVAEQMKPYFEKYGYYDYYEVNDSHICYYILSHDIPTNKKREQTVNTYVEFSDVIPLIDGAYGYDNMTLSGFDVYYKPQDGNYLNTHILADYLDESGNYAKDDYEARYIDEEYSLLSSAEGSLASFTKDTKEWVMSLDLNREDIKDMDCSITHYNRITEYGLTFLYPDARKAARVYRIDEKEFDEFEKPKYEFDGHTLTYKKEGNSNPCIYFKVKPDISKVEITTYDYETGEPEGPYLLDVIEIKGGLYTVTTGLLMYNDGYYLDKDQIIEFID